MAEKQRSVLITGCDVPNSYGYELALTLDSQNYTVFAGCSDCNGLGARSLASRGSTKLAVLQIDVTKQDEIDDAAEMIQDVVGDDGLWAVVNCAESYLVAEIDWCSVEDFHNILNVNYLGAVRVTKAMLHLVRKSRGRVINLSSLSGCLSRAGQAAYSSSKYAIEAFSDALRQEMLKWGVFVSIVQPAYFPGSKDVLSDGACVNLIGNLSSDLRRVYGQDYFVEYIKSVCPEHSSEESNKAKTPDSGYSTLSSDFHHQQLASLRKRALSNVDEAMDPNLPSGSNTSTLRQENASMKIPPKLGNTNRVLHALSDAVTSPSPKVRYFVGSFQSQVIKTISSFAPTVFMDTVMTSGDVSRVIPKAIKEKLE